MRRSFTGMALVLALLAPAAAAEAPQLPPGVFAGEHDFRAAPAGAYEIDPGHTAVIAKVSHIGYGLSVFRFDVVKGSLAWAPDDPTQCRLEAHVETSSIATPVAGFAKELAGPKYLNAAAYPEASFVSTAFTKLDDSHAKVDGTFTFLGQSKPMSFTVELQGAGKGFMGHPRLGVSATASMDPQAFGMSPLFATPINIEIEAEFQAK